MKRCQNCKAMYQGNSCDCGFEEKKKKRYEPKDDWIFKRRQELNGWESQIQRMNDYLASAATETMRSSVTNMLVIANLKIQEIENSCQSMIHEVRKVPDEMKCHGYHPEHGACSKFGTMCHLGSDVWFCRLHYQC